MAHVHHFTYGWLTPTLAFLLSYLGCLLGLVATARARQSRSSAVRGRWLVLGAWAIGGTGIWVMHFTAMIGFSVDGTAVGYDIPVTVASWLAAVIVVGIGLFIVGFGPASAGKVLAAGLFTGIGVAAMHYSGMAAVQVNGSIGYDRTRVALSVVIAVVAATAALWFTLVVRRARWIGVTAAVMALAVCSMHYTGMSAMEVRSGSRADVSATDALSFLPAILIFVLIVVVALLYAVLADPSAEDREWREQVRRWTEPAPVPAPTPPAAGVRLSAGLRARR
jgi:NO-binding membrane sensor protein with MHYT domain